MPVSEHTKRALTETNIPKDTDMAAFDTTRTTYGSTGLFGRIGAIFANVFGAFAAWNDSRATRRALSSLTDRELDDIGLNRGDIDLVVERKSVF